MKPIGLRAKLSLFYTALFTLLLVALYAGAYYLLKSDLENAASEELFERATALRGYFHFDGGVPVLRYDASDLELLSFIRSATRYYQVYDEKTGELIVQSQELEALGLTFTLTELTSLRAGPQLVDVATDEGRLRFFNDTIVSDDGRTFVIQVGETMEPADAALNRFGRMALFLLPVGLLLGGTTGFLMAGRALSPIREMVRMAQEIEVSHLDRRLPILGARDEIDTLAVTFNEMLNRLEKAVGEMKQFTASIAHELRTPLTALRGETEMALMTPQSPEAYKALLTSQLEEFDKLTRTVNQLLVLARAEAGELELQRESFDIVAMLRNLVDTFSLLASEKHIALDFTPPESLFINGDPQWLERAIVNLLDNAIKYTPGGGRVELRVAQDSKESRIEVRDTGCGIPAMAMPHIFERFFRADPSRGKEIDGVGLGLSLVRWIVDKHGGTTEVSSGVGEGTLFAIHLPLLPTVDTAPRYPHAARH